MINFVQLALAIYHRFLSSGVLKAKQVEDKVSNRTTNEINFFITSPQTCLDTRINPLEFEGIKITITSVYHVDQYAD